MSTSRCEKCGQDCIMPSWKKGFDRYRIPGHFGLCGTHLYCSDPGINVIPVCPYFEKVTYCTECKEGKPHEEGTGACGEGRH